MISREDQTWTNVMNNGGAELFEIAISLGRIADMLAEMNGYHVEYGEKQRAEEAHDVMPIIRCKDCKYSDTFSDMTAEPHSQLKCLGIRYGGVEPLWYCEHGERKDND